MTYFSGNQKILYCHFETIFFIQSELSDTSNDLSHLSFTVNVRFLCVHEFVVCYLFAFEVQEKSGFRIALRTCLTFTSTHPRSLHHPYPT